MTDSPGASVAADGVLGKKAVGGAVVRPAADRDRGAVFDKRVPDEPVVRGRVPARVLPSEVREQRDPERVVAKGVVHDDVVARTWQATAKAGAKAVP